MIITVENKPWKSTRSYVFYRIENQSKIIDVYISIEKSDQAQF